MPKFSFSDDLTANEVIDRCEQHYRIISTLFFTSEKVAQTSQGNTSEISYGETNRSIVKIDAIRGLGYYCVDITKRLKRSEQGIEEIPTNTRLEFLFRENTGFRFKADTDSNEVIGFHVTEDGVHNDKEKQGWKSAFFETYILCPIGIFKIDGKTIDIFEFIKSMDQLSMEMTKSDNEDCYKITAQSDRFKILFSVLPKRDFMMKSFMIEKKSVPPEYMGFRRIEYVASDFFDKSGYILPESFSLSILSGELINVQILQDGKSISEKLPKYRNKSHTKIIEIKTNSLSPKSFVFETQIPNGTNVYVDAVPQIEYIWFDGKVEPKTNELMLRIARGGHRFMPGVWEPRFWLITAGAVLIFLGLFFKIKMILRDWKEK